MSNTYNFQLSHLPEREVKPRQKGLTMVMDKGISLRQAQDFVETSSEYVDYVKLGFGTSLISKNVKEKVKLYKSAGMKVYVGGTLFEAFVIRNQFEEYIKYIRDFGMDCTEVSDGSINLDHDKKCEYISILAKEYTVLSEEGSKEERDRPDQGQG